MVAGQWMRVGGAVLMAAVGWASVPAWGGGAGGTNYVVHISFDGLGSSYLQTAINAGQAPHFRWLQQNGAWTNNARCDYDISVTLPNHTSQVTGRGVLGPTGHNWTSNSDPTGGDTIGQHGTFNTYIPGVFDVTHDNGLRTAMYAGKSKFSLYRDSYDGAHGAVDGTGTDYGRNKLDVFKLPGDAAPVASTFIADSQTNPAQYSFLHWTDLDGIGHSAAGGWGSPAYYAGLQSLDATLGQLLDFVQTTSGFAGHTLVVLTADHGGKAFNHADATEPLDYTIPFYAWGPTVQGGMDLYALNAGLRTDPGTLRPAYGPTGQPIRNGDAANLELELLGLAAIPGSTINADQSLLVPEPGVVGLLAIGALGLLRGRRRRPAGW